MTVLRKCRRKFTRFPARAYCWWYRNQRQEKISIRDISAGGMLGAFPVALSPGLKIRLLFEFSGHRSIILCLCRVVHCRQSSRPELFLAGLEILELEGADQVELVRMIINAGK